MQEQTPRNRLAPDQPLSAAATRTTRCIGGPGAGGARRGPRTGKRSCSRSASPPAIGAT